jgi:LysM repeat protein
MRSRQRLSGLEIAILAVSVLVLVAVALLPGLRASAPTWPGAVTVKVDSSQTLWGIAQAHPIEGLTTAQTVAAIRSANQLSDSALREGQLLRVPGAADSSAAMASR